MLKLLLPILFPSWRFFSSIGPSPRIEFAFLQHENDEPHYWREFRPRPSQINILDGLLRLFHSPRWNEMLYMNTCAEHLFECYSEMREQAIMQRILAALMAGEIMADDKASYIIYRISAVMREEDTVIHQLAFVSTPVALPVSNVV